MEKINQKTKFKILIVDDNAFEIELLDWVLKENNYQSVLAKNGAEAIEIVKTVIPDLILLDIMLPDINGFEVCQKIKSNQNLKDIPIIFFTSLSKVEDIVKGFEVGGVDYVTKPFNQDELLVRVKNHLDLISSKRKIEIQARELAQSNALKDKMFSVISHDLRSPVSSIKQTLDFISSGMIKPDDDLFFETIKDLIKTSDEAYVLLENLLGWAKSQSNVLKVIPEKISLNPLAKSIVGLMKLNFENKKIRVVNRIAENITVYADLQMVNSILRNLLSNALKFTPENGLIEINAFERKSEVEIRVQDSGVGVSESNLRKILNPDQAIQTYGTNSETGSGLGLILCKDFVEKNGGHIWLESKSGKGSTFFFTLPLQ